MQRTAIMPCSQPRGITLAEAVIATLIIAVTTAGLIQGFHFGCVIAKRASRETTAELRAVQRIEEILLTSYDQVNNSLFPVEYVTVTQGTTVALSFAMTTTVTEVLSPVAYKHVAVDVTWQERGHDHHTRYLFLRAPVEMRSIY
jgi:Tfp pilus assembly protein PilV